MTAPYAYLLHGWVLQLTIRTLASALARMARGDASKAGDVCWQQWQGDRGMVAAAVRIQQKHQQGEGKGMTVPDQHRQGKGNAMMVLPQR
jgi:hypothetical protein